MVILRSPVVARCITYVIPVIGVLFFGWSAFAILLFFCAENILQGVFFLLRGAVSVYYGGGIGFLIAFSVLYFAHAIAVTRTVFLISHSLVIITIPSVRVIVVNLAILSLPLFSNLFQFAETIKKIKHITSDSNIPQNDIDAAAKKENLTPLIDFLLSIKEMFYRIGAIWLTLSLASAIAFISYYFDVSPVVSSTIFIAVFSYIHFLFDSYAFAEREKIMAGYASWKTGEPTVGTTV